MKEAQCCEKFPLVSIITPSYNQGIFIRETIDSVLKQSYPNIEYVIIDGGSTDNTIEILKEYGSKIKWISEKDNGQADAINKGIALTQGKFIGWLNSDDTYLDDAIYKLVSFMVENEDVDMVYGEGWYVDKNGNITERYLTEEFSKERLGEQCIICQPTALFSRKIVEEVGMLDAEYQLGMDYELWLRIANKGKVVHILDYVATSRMYDENKTLSRKKEAYVEACKAVKKNYGYVPASWTRGYAFYLCKEKKNIVFVIVAILLFIKYNWNNWEYVLMKFKKIKRKKHGKNNI